MTTVERGALAPHFALLGLDGRDYTLPGGAAGDQLLLVFLRTSCDTCDLAVPYVNRLREVYPRKGWHIWAICQDSPEKVAAYAERHGIKIPLLIDAPALDVSHLYDPPSTPAFFLIGPNGRVKFAFEGFDKADLNHMSALIARHLGVPPVEIAPADDGNPAMKPGCMSRHLFPVRRG